MRFGIVGLGRMGSALALQALEKGHEPVAYNRSPEKTTQLAQQGILPAFSYTELVEAIEAPRLILSYVPHGKPTDDVIDALAETLDEGDVVADGGNSHWRESMRRGERLAAEGIRFLDVGTSGGVRGARHGACFMTGGDADAYRVAEPLLTDLAVPGGAVRVGGSGAGHFVKLIHNGIEFAMVQAIAEGVEMLARGDHELDLADVFSCWSHGSVIRSWLTQLMEECLREGPSFDALSSRVEDTKEGKWYVEYALEREIHAPILTLAEMMFYRYRDPESHAGKAVALMRHAYGEHPLHFKNKGADAGDAPRHEREAA